MEMIIYTWLVIGAVYLISYLLVLGRVWSLQKAVAKPPVIFIDPKDDIRKAEYLFKWHWHNEFFFPFFFSNSRFRKNKSKTAAFWDFVQPCNDLPSGIAQWEQGCDYFPLFFSRIKDDGTVDKSPSTWMPFGLISWPFSWALYIIGVSTSLFFFKNKPDQAG